MAPPGYSMGGAFGPLPCSRGPRNRRKVGTSVRPLAELRQSGEARREGSTGVGLGGRRLNFVRVCVLAMLTVVVVGLSPARAVEAINVRTDAPAIDVTDAAERQ